MTRANPTGYLCPIPDANVSFLTVAIEWSERFGLLDRYLSSVDQTGPEPTAVAARCAGAGRLIWQSHLFVTFTTWPLEVEQCRTEDTLDIGFL
jgi:hypothetical protein